MLEIKRIITAIGNPELNKELRIKDINVLCGDILYKEGIIEFLEKNNDIDFIIINENLSGNISIENLVQQIKEINKNIKIILITKNINSEIKVFRKIENAESKKIIDIIINKKSYYDMKTIPINNFFNEETKDGKIISILGPNGIGKSIFSIIFSNSLKDKEVLIVDFDFFNKNLINLLGVKNRNLQNRKDANSYFENFDINDFIVKIENNIDYLLSINLLYNSEIQASSKSIRNMINRLKSKYDYIIVDTMTEGLIEYTKEILKITDEIVFISGANLLEIKKAQRLLDIKEMIKIIFNKYTKQSLDDSVLREIFRNYEILGKIKLSDYYDLAINKNIAKQKNIQKDIAHIGKKIVKIKVLRKNKKWKDYFNGISIRK